MSFRQAGDEEDDEAKDRTFGLDDEAHLVPGLLTDQSANIVAPAHRHQALPDIGSVSYTHLTLPTKRIV